MEEFGLWRLQGQGRWWLLERWGEVEVVRQPADILLPWRAGRGDLLMEAGFPVPLLRPQAWDMASTSGWASRPCEE